MNTFKILLFAAVFTGCMNRSSNQAPKNPDADNLKVRDYITIDTTNGGNQIVLAKMCSEDPTYKYMYQLKNGMWVASNDQWCVGTQITFNSVETKPETKKENVQADKKSDRKPSSSNKK